MDRIDAFREQVQLKYQLYNGLFLALPFEHVKDAGVTLPVFAEACRQELERGKSPAEIVEGYFVKRGGRPGFKAATDLLFRFLQLIERQVVLFDALEDAAFPSMRDIVSAGSLDDILTHVEDSGRRDAYRKFVKDYQVRIVLTAHPTQFYPDEVLGIITDLADAVAGNDIRGINDLLLQMGKTRFRNREKPTPVDEAKGLLWYMQNVFYEVIPEIHRRLLAPLEEDDAHLIAPRVLLGFWPGGDRDGNPFVTSDLTVEVARLLRSSILSLYRRDLATLLRRLTFDGVVEEIKRIEGKLSTTAYPFRLVVSDDPSVPTGCEAVEDDGYESAEEFLSDLVAVRTTLETNHSGLFVELVDALLAKVQAFGFHFATMDIRQDSRVHAELISKIVKHVLGESSDYHSSNRKLELIEQVADSLPPREALSKIPESDVERDAIQSIRTAITIQQLGGGAAAHRYIISNSRGAASVMEVWLLALCAGLDADDITLDIVPLFETLDDLDAAPMIMDELYTLPIYRRHLTRRRGVQTIMVGFSDGTKDGGYVSANYAIFRAKEALTDVTRKHGFSVVFFDGRGGPPARGGGNTHKFYRSLGRRIDSHELQLTVQGQTISSKYGTQAAARHNIEQLVSAGIENNLFPENCYDLTDDDRKLMDEFSQVAKAAYRALKQHPKFLSYLEELTPLSYYGQTNIGSRPARRNRSAKLNMDDLRAIPFVGAWSQMKQNVPGYFGLGAAIDEFSRNGRMDELRRLYGCSLFFRTLVENAMQSLSKSSFALTYYLNRDDEFGSFWKMLYDEMQLSVCGIREVAEVDSLLDNEPVTRESIAMREAIVLPLQVIQQFALATIRQIDAGDIPKDGGWHYATSDGAPSPADVRELLSKMVLKSLAPSVNASRNAV